MAEKISAYQKLKAKNKELARQINLLVMQPDSTEALVIKEIIKLNHQVEKAVWFGTIN